MIYIAPKKRAIPEATRRAVALRHGPQGAYKHSAPCFYCGALGFFSWMTPSWVHFTDLELDHLVPDVRGGQAVPENIVLACQNCNRRKGHRGGWT